MLAGCGFTPNGAGPLSSDAPIGTRDAPLAPVDGTDASHAIDAPAIDAALAPCGGSACPASCVDQPDGSATLYLGSNANEPWPALCVAGVAYLAVPAATNFGQYTAGGAAHGTTVKTSYTALRFHPETLVIDIDDRASRPRPARSAIPTGRRPSP